MEIPIKLDDLGVPPLSETPIWVYKGDYPVISVDYFRARIPINQRSYFMVHKPVTWGWINYPVTWGLWSISHEISGSRHFRFFQRRWDAEKISIRGELLNQKWGTVEFLKITQEVQWILRYFFQKWGATTIGQQTSTPNSDRWLHIYRSAGDHSTAGAGTAVFFWWIFEANSARNGKSACWYQWCGPCNNQDNRSKVLKGSFYSKFWRRLLPWQIFLKNGCRINHHLKQLWQLFSWTCYIYIYICNICMYIYTYMYIHKFCSAAQRSPTYHDTRSTSRKKIRKGGECDRAAGMHLPAN